MKIAVIGHNGVVGGAAYKYFQTKGWQMMGLSLSVQTHTWDEINRDAAYIFVAVPTPFDYKKRKCNIEIVFDVLTKIKDGKVVVIKSTIPPGTTESLQIAFPKLKLLFNPEFLTAKKAYEDFINADTQIVGYTRESFRYAMDVLNLLPQAPYERIMTATEAEICKYINNMYKPLQIMLGNFFYDVAKATGSNFDILREFASSSKAFPRMGKMYWDVNMDGFRGYGGMCFPKDTNALLEWAKKKKIKTSRLIEEMIEMNKELLAEQDLTEEEASKII